MTAAATAAKETAALNLSGRIPELDGLRGLAIGSVLIWHYFVLPTVAAPATPLSRALVLGRLTWSGVDLFFVLSGFLIGGILLDARESSNYFRVFYTRRFFRIVPIYAVLLLSVGFTRYLLDSGVIRGNDEIFAGRLPWWYFATFLQNLGMSVHKVWGTIPLGVTWSLAVEEQFYLTLPLLIRFLDRRALLRCILLAVVAAFLLRTYFSHRYPRDFFMWYTLTPCRADSLFLGVLGVIVLREPRWRGWLLNSRRFSACVLGFLCVGSALLAWRFPSPFWGLMVTVGYTWLALTYLAFLLYALLYRGSWISHCLRWRWLCELGVIAYGTYLFHEFFLHLFFRGTPWFRCWHDLALSIVVLVVTISLCRLSWVYFEKPLVKIGRRATYQFGATGAARTATPAEGS
jgi:peptidoglycan/LPS O-acetylase OafA/YrhL